MAAPEQNLTDPLTLLPTVLNHLTSVQTKPSLATSVFATVRKTFRTSKSQPFVTPLLPPLTAIALTSTQTNVRLDAANTCATLLRGLVSRRVSPIAAAYVEDLVSLARSLIHSNNNVPLPCELTQYSKIAKNATNYHVAIETSATPLSITPESLEAIFQLLSHFIPSIDSELVRRDPVHHNVVNTASTRLWICIGTAARCAVLDLASSYAVLSERYGEGPSCAAVNLLERILNHASVCVLPTSSLECVRAAVEAVLQDGFPSLNDETSKRRAVLYHIARLASTERVLSAELWTSCGIREAAKAGTLAQRLTKLSNQGMVQPCFRDSVENWDEGSEGTEPPKKRRRLSQHQERTSGDDRETFSTDSSQIPSVDPSQRAVSGLQRSLQSIESLFACTEDASYMRLLGKACMLTADSLNIIARGSGNYSKSFQEWISFASSLGLIIRDLSTGLHAKLKRDIWVAMLEVCQAAICLIAGLHRIESMASSICHKREVCRAVSGMNVTENLITGLAQMLDTASNVLDSADFPLTDLGDFLFNLGELALSHAFTTIDEESFLSVCKRLQDAALDGDSFDTQCQTALLRGSTHVFFAMTKRCAAQQGTQVLPLLTNILSTNIAATPEIIAATACALADTVCLIVECRDTHGSRMERKNGHRDKSVLHDPELWAKGYDAIVPYFNDTVSAKVLIGSLRCLGSLALHSPPAKVNQCVSLLWDILWSQDHIEAKNLAYMFLSDMLKNRVDARKYVLSKSFQDVSVSHSAQCCAAGDTILAEENGNAGLVYTLLRDVRKRVEQWHQEQNREVDKSASGNTYPMVLTMRLTSEGLHASKLCGLTIQALLSASSDEFSCLEGIFARGVGSQENVKRSMFATAHSILKTWLSILQAVSCHSGHFASVANQENHQLFERRGGLGHLPQDSTVSSQSLSQIVANFFTSRFRDWLPHALPRILNDSYFASVVAQLITGGDVKRLFVKVPRHAMEVILKDRNMTQLKKLASNVDQSHSALVEKASADALARIVMDQEDEIDTSPTGSNAFILGLLQQPLENIISKRAGKIVQKLVMEFGTSEETRAKRGLMSLSKLLKASVNNDSSSDSKAGALLSQHFMLVMDAVNRGLFHSKASPADRFRYLRMLEVVISMATEQLHLFVPKILATLKLALQTDRGNEDFRSQTLRVWVGFLKTLGPTRMVPHLGSILSTLLPFYGTHDNILAPSLTSLVEVCAGQQMNNRRDIVLLLRVANHKDLTKAASILEASSNGHPPIRGGSQKHPRMSVREISMLTRSVGSVIANLENGTIEVLSVQYLLRMLKWSREQLSSAAAALGKDPDGHPSDESAALASTSGALVDLLTRTNNVDCQKVLLQCIGEVGAIDPAFVREMYHNVVEEEERETMALNVQYPSSVYSLVALLLDNFLIPTLTKGEQQGCSSSRQNRVGLVIQELLRVCGCKKNTAKRASKTLRNRKPGDGQVGWDKVLVGETKDENAIFFWENLLTTTRNVAEPYLDEPFDVQHYRSVFGESAAGDTNRACQPVWAKVKIALPTGKIATAQEWRRQMIVQLVDFIGKQGDFGEVLKALRPVLRYEDDVAAFIFPLVIATTLDIQHGKQGAEVSVFLTGEIAKVLQEGSSPQLLFDLFDTLRHWRDQRCTEQARMTMTTNPGSLKSAGNSAITSRRKIPLDAYVELEKDQDPLSAFVDLGGRASTSLSLLLQARSAFRAKSYSRAVMMAETHIRNVRNKIGLAGWPSFIDDILRKDRSINDSRMSHETESLRLLQRAFAELEDSENMTAVAALRGNSSLAELVIDCEAAARYDEALAVYERALASHPHSITFHEGFLGCLMTLGHWESMLSHAKGLLSSSNLSDRQLREIAKANGISAAWRLGRWTELEDFHNSASEASNAIETEQSPRSWALRFSTSLGEMLLSLRKGKLACLHQAADEARRHILSPIVKAAREGYSRAYPLIVLMHSLSDIEDSCRDLEHSDEFPGEGRGASLQEVSSKRLISLTSRTEASKPSLTAREPLISVKRVCYELIQNPNDAARANLGLALLGREAGNLQLALASAHRAVSADSIDNHVRNASVLEMARIQRAQGDCCEALKTVKVEIEGLTSVLEQGKAGSGQIAFVREISSRLCTALVLAGCWTEETRGEPSEVILSYFERAATYGPSREEPFYALGRHYDSLLQASANSDERTSQASVLHSGRVLRRSGWNSDSDVPHHSVYVPLIIKSFAQALVNGHSRIFEALPRMLTVWFDYHTELDDPNAGGTAVMVESNVRQEMKKAFDNIPGYMWMTAVPQIMSRILHPRKQVREDLTNLLAKIVCLFPDQCFWTILPSSQLKSVDRKRAAGSILNHAMALTKKKGKPGEARENARILRSRIQSALSVVTSFVSICMNLLPKEKRGRRENCSREFSELKSYLRANMAMNPIVPTLNSLTTRLPYSDTEEHRPFETEPVRIVDIEDFVLVMVSLMRPRRIGLVGSDGRAYRYLAKKENQGDMRKDSRLVELITVVNRLLSKKTCSRDTKLALKTYAVLPLSEETGMIEWVNDLVPLRNLVRDEHNRLPTVPDTQQIQSKYQTMTSHKKFLMDWAFVKFPTVLDKFFLRQFGQSVNAEAWLTARNLWTESTAVWSMVGYVAGLGDRHGENVLLETTSGRCVHVDFAMLFDKGLKLKVPEIVPFRLTRNMVTAMGIAGYEGVFRAVSENVLEIMRRNADAILGVLESFLHDPLADWGRSEARVSKGGVLATKEAWQTRAAVKAKLTGIVDNSGLSLSIKGQVQRLIQEATNIENLSEMYLWWSAWI